MLLGMARGPFRAPGPGRGGRVWGRLPNPVWGQWVPPAVSDGCPRPLLNCFYPSESGGCSRGAEGIRTPDPHTARTGLPAVFVGLVQLTATSYGYPRHNVARYGQPDTVTAPMGAVVVQPLTGGQRWQR